MAGCRSTYTAAPIPAAAVLSGAGVKAGVIGLIRFLPLGAAFPGWGEALAWVGFISAFYGVAIGVTQRDPKTMLAYSSISQMGVIAAALGMGLASADQGAATNVAFYAANHVLVKAALFLTVGVVAALDGRARKLALIVAALLGLSLAGLPLTGGALAKLAVKDLFGDGAAGVAAQLSAAATTALMLMFVMRLARLPAAERAAASRGRLWSWVALAVAALLVPWLMFPAIGSPAEALEPAKLWDAVWPMLSAPCSPRGLWAAGDRLPRIPAGDIVVAEEAAFRASPSRGRVRAGRSRLAPVAGGGPGAAHDRARARCGRATRADKARTRGERWRQKKKRGSAAKTKTALGPRPAKRWKRRGRRSRSATSPKSRLRGSQSQDIANARGTLSPEISAVVHRRPGRGVFADRGNLARNEQICGASGTRSRTMTAAREAQRILQAGCRMRLSP